MNFEPTLAFASALDAEDSLSKFRQEFIFPQKNGQDVIYFCGNSLGLQPRSTEATIAEVMDAWAGLGIEGFKSGRHPWMEYQQELSNLLAPLMGAQPNEVSAMNSLTINLHLLLQTFYRPAKDRLKIIMEAGSFPSDRYAVISLLKKAGLQPEEALIELKPRQGELCLRTNDILDAIEMHASSLALVLFSGVQYYTGQLFDIPAITLAAHRAGALAGWDLAHAAGNVPLKLHEDDIDFAVWCHYKYLNGGPGAVGGAFVHSKHFDQYGPALTGWWGNHAASRFQMQPDFEGAPGIDAWHVSTPNMIGLAAVKAGLQKTNEAGIQHLRSKSVKLTAYLEYLLSTEPFKDQLQIISPADPHERGAQLSVFFKEKAEDIQEALLQAGVIADYRRPGVIRIAPAPLYCSFSDVFRCSEVIAQVLETGSNGTGPF